MHRNEINDATYNCFYKNIKISYTKEIMRQRHGPELQSRGQVGISTNHHHNARETTRICGKLTTEIISLADYRGGIQSTVT